jgi:hypothetical protein
MDEDYAMDLEDGEPGEDMEPAPKRAKKAKPKKFRKPADDDDDVMVKAKKPSAVRCPVARRLTCLVLSRKTQAQDRIVSLRQLSRVADQKVRCLVA